MELCARKPRYSCIMHLYYILLRSNFGIDICRPTYKVHFTFIFHFPSLDLSKSFDYNRAHYQTRYRPCVVEFNPPFLSYWHALSPL